MARPLSSLWRLPLNTKPLGGIHKPSLVLYCVPIEDTVIAKAAR